MIEKLKKNKTYVIVIVVLIIYLIVFRIVSLNLNKENSKYASIVVDGINIWEYKNSTWNILGEDEFVNDEIYDLYSSTEFYGDYNVRVNNGKLYAFDSKYNSLKYNGSIMGINSNYDINVIPVSFYGVNDSDRNILNGYINNNYTYDIKRFNVDIDSDKEEEFLYVIEYFENNASLYSEIYYYDGGLRDVISNDGSRYNIYDIAYVVDINNDKKYELIVSSDYLGNVSYKVYKLSGKNFSLFLE